MDKFAHRGQKKEFFRDDHIMSIQNRDRFAYTILGILSLLFLGGGVAAEKAIHPDGEWPMYRHDKRLTGRSHGLGDFTHPHIAWQYDLRGYQWWISVTPSEEKSRFSIHLEPSEKRFDDKVQNAWGLGSPMIDLAGDGALQPAPPSTAKILKSVPGFQTVTVKMLDHFRGRCELIAYNQGRHTVWRSEEFKVFQQPHPVIADANGDGQLDVIVCPHYQVAVLDGRTGETIEQLRWHNGRNYGHFIVKNIDKDPALEMCVLADFYTHMEVIDNDGTNLKLLWRKEIELKIENKLKILRPRWDCLRDLDADGRFELVVNLYNDTGDRRWHVMIYDAITGQTKLDLPDLFMEGLDDIDGDGKAELFCTETRALFVPVSARLQIINYEQGKTVTRWTYPKGAWVTASNPYPLYINSTVAYGNKNVVITDLGHGEQAFYIRVSSTANTDRSTLQAFRVTKSGRIQPMWSCEGTLGSRELTVEATRESDGGQTETLLSSQTARPGGTLTLQQGQGELIGQKRTPPELAQWGSLIAAKLGKDRIPTVVTMSGNREIVALTLANGCPSERWRKRGAGPLAAYDFDGDGLREVAMLGWEPSGEGNVTVCRADGSILCEKPIYGFPGPLEPWNFGTLTYLAAGRFTGSGHEDLLVFARRSTMHSDEGFVLNGANGNLVWCRDGAFDGTRTWGFGGTPVAVLDQDGDGAEDIHSLYPVNYTVVSGRDGRQMIGRSAAGDDIFPGIWAAYSIPTLFDFNRDGTNELLWCGGYALGVTDLSGSTRWGISSKLRTDEGNNYFALANAYPVDWTGSHRYSIAAVGGDALHSYEPEKGALQWRFPLSGRVESALVGDLNGDGGDEVVVLHGSQISCIGAKNNLPAMEWTLPLPGTVHEAILADTDGDGTLEIVALTSNGFLCGLNQ